MEPFYNAMTAAYLPMSRKAVFTFTYGDGRCRVSFRHSTKVWMLGNPVLVISLE